MWSLAWLKALSALTSFLVAIGGCLLARWLDESKSKGKWRDALLIFGNTLASGILLAASLVHMLPDAIEALEDVTPFPLAPALAGTCFCFLVALGELLNSWLPKREDPHTETHCVAYEASFSMWPRWELSPPHGCTEDLDGHEARRRTVSGSGIEISHSGHGDHEGGHSHAVGLAKGADPRQIRLLEDGGHGDGHGHGHGHVHGASHGAAAGGAGSSSSTGHVAGPSEASHGHGHGSGGLMDVLRGHTHGGDRHRSREAPAPAPGHNWHSHASGCRIHRHADEPCCTTVGGSSSSRQLSPPAGAGHASLRKNLLSPERSATAPACQTHESGNQAGCTCHVVERTDASTGFAAAEVQAFFLFFALGFHSVMEGLGLGTASGTGLMLPIITAILAHKGLAAFALGCSLSSSGVEKSRYLIFVLLFALGTPVGCVCGMLILAMGSTAMHGPIEGVCIALASGTFLQVASMELLPRVFAEDKHKPLACAGLFIGFWLMSFLALWV
eukprot:TRINITY_DN12440_c0_g1_i1.p1 TRINITY_DN12440_c0_g1~~TRINITY_DN12440_c0_g1_i1.p1  ORF type:complete len:501 (+),score=87.55 TRINITY_DN12440_c0_g1_i1:68-1570(+)